jgi:hypothetical protein
MAGDEASKKLAPETSTVKLSNIIRVNTDAEYDLLPSGSEFVGPDGVRRRKP